METRWRERRRKGCWMVASRNTPLPSIRLHDAELSQVTQLHVPEGLPGADDRSVCRRGTAGQHTLIDSRQPSTPLTVTSQPVHPWDVVEAADRRTNSGQSLALWLWLQLDYFSFTLVVFQHACLSLFSHTHPFCPALGALLLNCRLSFCLNLGGAALAPLAPSTAAFISAATGSCRISALTQRSPFSSRHEITFPHYSSF